MTPRQYVHAIETLGIGPHRVAGPLLGTSRRTSERWAKGTSAVPRSVELLLGLMHLPGVLAMLNLEAATKRGSSKRTSRADR